MSDKKNTPKPDIPESTLRIMERMVKTPPKPHEKAAAKEDAAKVKSEGKEN